MATTSSSIDIADIVSNQRAYFREGYTRSIEARQKILRNLKKAVENHHEALMEAVHQDFKKPPHEALYEIAMVLEEIDKAIKHLPSWARSKHISVPLMYQPASAKSVPEPYGVVLVIAPWNYPIDLTLVPAIGAIAAGNTVIIKPSEFTTESSRVLAEMISEFFPAELITVVEGEAAETQALIEAPVDYVLFTGSSPVGKKIMASAAKNLVPVTLELGGKNPTLIDEKVGLEAVARRITWSKTFNAGQSCLASDYVLVPNSRKADFIQEVKKQIDAFYGKNPQESKDYARVINDKNFERLKGLIEGNVVAGGTTDAADRYIEPTVIDVENPDTHVCMQDEIFGPILPVIGYDSIEEAITFINDRPKPLACYIFSDSSRFQKRVEQETSSGSFIINDLMIQFAISDLPFGGVGNSGVSAYHGEKSFQTFSHYKSVLKRSLLLDIPFRYPPYKASVGFLKSLMKWFG